MKTVFKYITIAFAVFFVLGCSGLDELTKRVDELESKVNAALAQIEKINANIEALQALAEATTINKVEENGGVYTITLSNGETLTLNQGAMGVGNAPVMSIDKDGYWMVDYGNGAEYLLVNGEKVKARGENGAAPQFGVNADGNWTVSYNGSEPEEVLGADGKPVSAVNGDAGDPYFNDVRYAGGKFTLTLKDGSVIELPIVPEFLFAIKDAEGGQVFEAGKSKVYTVEQKGIASASIIAYPEGWKAELDETTLIVTAPMATKVAADTETDIAVLAISEKGFSTIAKIQVKLDGTVVVTTPVASVSVGEATSSSLVYNVTLKNADAYKYMHKLASEAAPTMLELTADGTESTGTSLLVEGLESETEYALYVLPYDSEKTGEIVRTTHRTTEKTYGSLYEQFMDKGSITIAGKTYNKSEYADENIVQIADEEFDAAEGKIYFVGGAANIKSIAPTNVIVIGENPAAKPVFTMKGSNYLKPASGKVSRKVLHNVVIDGSAMTTYMFTVNGDYDTAGAFDQFVLSSCDISTGTGPFYSISGKRYLNSFIMVDCNVNMKEGTNRFIIHTNNLENTFAEIVYKGNVFYSAGLATGFRLLSGQTNGTNATELAKIAVENNTFVNVVNNNSSLIIAKTVSSLSFSKNLFYVDKTATGGKTVLFCGPGTYPEKDKRNVLDNISYDTNDVNFNMFYHSANVADYDSSTERVEKISENPLSVIDFTNGVFTPVSAYASYGAGR